MDANRIEFLQDDSDPVARRKWVEDYYAQRGFPIPKKPENPNAMPLGEFVKELRGLLADGFSLQEIAEVFCPNPGPEPSLAAVAQFMNSITPDDVRRTRLRFVLAARAARRGAVHCVAA
jgi:hypothetical protein